MKGCWPILCLLFLAACSPSKDSFLRDVALNYNQEGFLTTDIFQVRCSSYSKHRPQLEAELPGLSDREKLLKICRLMMAKKLAEYKIRYDFYMREKLKRQPGTPQGELRSRFLQFSWSYPQLKALRNHYKDLFPGYMVSESRQVDTMLASYRIKKKDLIEEIQARELPFTVQADRPL